jgi:hypothetical protein
MKNYLILITSVVFFTMFSCSPAQKEAKPTQVQEQNQQQEIKLNADTLTNVATDTTSLSVPVQPAATAMLNPPHGQPFHRCDIPVGSPLSDAPPAKPAPTVNRTGTAPTLENAARLNNTATPAPTVSNANAPKLNPPHGQPFHRCEIPVGSPLN